MTLSTLSVSAGAVNPTAVVADDALAGLDAQALLRRLLAAEAISPDPAQRAASLYQAARVHPLTGLLRLNAVSEAVLYREASRLSGLPLIDPIELGDFGAFCNQVDAAVQQLGLAWNWLSEKGILVYQQEGHWKVAVREAIPPDAVAMLRRKLTASKLPVQWQLAAPSLLDRLRATLDKRERDVTPVVRDDLQSLRELAEEGPTIELVNAILSKAVTQRASDVHFEAEEFEFFVRVRVDGEMLEQTRQPRSKYDAVACRLKILASLDIAERRLPQDGRINARVNGEAFDIRVSILPAAYGESIVLRLLRQERKPTHLGDLGMTSTHAALFQRWISLSNGIVLVTGPTGSGKSTTLYTALELANDRSQKIITIEDPVEFKIPGLTQLQVNSDIGFSFATALRSILRHDPDLILVGEIRDEETARIAIQSALTGHLVLSTLHTNSALGAVTRLIDMGVEPFLIAASVRGLMAQRLVRRLCPHCRAPATKRDEALLGLFERFKLSPCPGVMQAVGCEHCSGTGYRGRIAIYDLIEITPELGHLIAVNAGEGRLTEMMGPHAGQGLLSSGVDCVAQGETSLSEVLRAVGSA